MRDIGTHPVYRLASSRWIEVSYDTSMPMKATGEHNPPGHHTNATKWWKRMFVSATPEVMVLLLDQGKVSIQALAAFSSWSSGGGTEAAAQVRELEHKADDTRKDLLAALRRVLVTPIDQEDIYVLSERCDRIVNAAKNIVREAEVLEWEPDEHAAFMGEHLSEGVSHLGRAFEVLGVDHDAAGQSADMAIRSVRSVEYGYRQAMASLRDVDDLKSVFVCREMYRSYARAADLVSGVSDRLWYVVLAGN